MLAHQNHDMDYLKKIHDLYAMGSIVTAEEKFQFKRLENSKTWLQVALGNQEALAELFAELERMLVGEDNPEAFSLADIISKPLNEGYDEDRHYLVQYIAGQGVLNIAKHPIFFTNLINEVLAIGQPPIFTPIFVAVMAYRAREKENNAEACEKLKALIQFFLEKGAFATEDKLASYLPGSLVPLFRNRVIAYYNEENESFLVQKIKDLDEAAVWAWMNVLGESNYRNLNRARDSVLELALCNLSIQYSDHHLDKKEVEKQDRERLPKMLFLVGSILLKNNLLLNEKALTRAVIDGDPQVVEMLLRNYRNQFHVQGMEIERVREALWQAMQGADQASVIRRYCDMARVLNNFTPCRDAQRQQGIEAYLFANRPDILEKTKQNIVAHLDHYLSFWKLSLFGHKHNARAEAVKAAILKAGDLETVKAILNNQMKLVSKEHAVDILPEVLDPRWASEIHHRGNEKDYSDDLSIYWLNGDEEKLRKMKSGEIKIEGNALVFMSDSTFYRIDNGHFIYPSIFTDLRTHQNNFIGSPDFGMQKLIHYLNAQIFDDNGKMLRPESNLSNKRKLAVLSQELFAKRSRGELPEEEFTARIQQLPRDVDHLDNAFIFMVFSMAQLKDVHLQSSGYYRAIKEATLIVDSAEAQLLHLKADLNQYIQRIESHTTADGQTDFSHGFSIFKNSRALNRQANYVLALELRETLDIDRLADGVVKLNRDTKERLLERREELITNLHLNEEADFVDRGVNSEELMAIIDRAATFKR